MKNLFTIFMLVFLGNSAFSQSWTINYCSSAPNLNLGSNSYGPMNTVATANATNRTAVIYPSSQLTGIAGKEFSIMYFYKVTLPAMLGSSANFKLYLAETTATDWGTAALDWATATSTATKVFDGDPQPIADGTAGWKGFNFSTLFTYSGTKNLAVFMEYTNPSASNSFTWAYEYTASCISTTNNNTTKYVNNTTGTPGTSLSSANYRRPYIGFTWTGACSSAVSVLATTNVTANSATINWSAGNPAPSNGYSYYYSTSNTTPTSSTTPSGTVGAGITTADISGLIEATKYYFWIRPECGSNSGDWSAMGSFNTSCLSTALPWTENFDSYTAAVGNLPPCWAQQAAATGNAQYSIANAATHTYNDPKSAPNYVTIYYHNNVEYYLWTPGFSMTANSTYKLKFSWAGDGVSGWSGKVYANNAQNPTGATTLNTFVTPSTTTSATYKDVSVDFTPSTTGVYYFGIGTNSTTTSPWWLGFDDFSVTDNVLATNNSNLDQAVQIFPNPTKDVLNVKGMIPTEVSIFTADGRTVPVKFEGSVIDTKNLSAGNYVIQMKDKNGNTTTKRFIKK